MDDYFYKSGYNRGFAISHNANSEAAFYYTFNGGGGCNSNPYPDSCYTKVVVGAAERQNFANWFTYYRTREMSAKAGIGTVFANPDLSSDFRLGWGLINQGRNTVDDATNVRAITNGVRPYDSVRTNFINWLYGVNSTGATPLQRALEGAGQYYEKSERAWLDDPGKSKSSANPARECRISATMLMTDGYYNVGRSYDPDLTVNADNVDGPEITNSAGDSGQYKAVPPFSDSVTSRVTLADIAAHYWKRDLRPDIDNFVPTIDEVRGGSDARSTVGNPAFWQHMMTYGIGFGVEGTVSRDDAVSAVLNGTRS
jgi:type IV pilus assembly protein PilY1